MNYHHRHVWPIIRKSVRKTLRKPLRVLADEPMAPHKREHQRRVYSHREPLPLLVGNTGKCVAWACGSCGSVQSGKFHGLAHAKEQARQCCLWRDRCRGCGVAIDRQQSKCRECWSRDSFERTRDMARKAQIIEDDGESVCCEQSSGEWREGYSSSIEAHLQAWDEQMGEWTNRGPHPSSREWVCPPPPPFVFATTPCTPQVDQQQIDESMAEDLYEDFDVTDLPGHDALCAAIERFNAIQRPASYMVDYTRVIVLDAERFAEYLEETWSGTPDVNYRQGFDPARVPVYPPRPASEIAAEAAARLTAQREDVTP